MWDWSILNGCFGETRIAPTDIDGLVERNGTFLYLETKHPNVEIKRGQMLTLLRLVATGFFTVLVIWGERNQPQKIRFMSSAKSCEFDADLDKLRDIVSRWYLWADQRGFTLE